MLVAVKFPQGIAGSWQMLVASRRPASAIVSASTDDDLDRVVFDDVLLDLTVTAPNGTLRDCAREAVLGLGIVAPNFTVENGGAA